MITSPGRKSRVSSEKDTCSFIEMEGHVSEDEMGKWFPCGGGMSQNAATMDKGQVSQVTRVERR